MNPSDVRTGARYEGANAGNVREVLGISVHPKHGYITVDWVRVPGNVPRTCSLVAFCRWAKVKL
jgi:hypothetical protein